jgi:signal transduction histidine kinase
MTAEELVERLQKHRTLGTAPRAELEWVATHGTVVHFKPGEVVVSRDQVVQALYILLSGRISIRLDRGTGRQVIMGWTGGDVTGLLPYSRLISPPGDTTVEEPTEAVAIARELLPEMTRACYEITATLVHVMTDRARVFTSNDLHDEKLLSLGKLAAGLAHELNNPASAAMRGAKSLERELAESEGAACTLAAARLTESQLHALAETLQTCISVPEDAPQTALARADREDGIAGWLESHGAEPASAESLVRTNVTIVALDRLAEVLQGQALDAALQWIASACAARSTVQEIQRATMRVHALVDAVKGFTHLDKATARGPVDIARGLTDTLAVLEGKARSRSVAVNLDCPPDLPRIHGSSIDLNQVWEKLIDNALDAVPANGHVDVKATCAGASIVVSVSDDGPGIPADIQSCIFDPFFTTKPVGEGTGLGLDIARRLVRWHNGEINVESNPGRTVFQVRLPLSEERPLPGGS